MSKPVYNHDLYNRKKNKINLNNYFKLMTRVVVNLIDNSYEDIIGNFQKGELETALIIAKDTLIKAITAYVYSNHKSIDRGKWAYIKLKSLSFENDEALEILNKFNQLYFFSNMNDISEIEKLIEEYIYFINRIIELAGKKLGGY
ncbi:hypothetical protein NSQ96_16795 [Caldifermentibacillus hisashii]|uniref:hypothetical protein n=1 Tax=Caldifermentibacillus hisashii TaxID=996558 RepID=UPI0031FCC4EC